jgi:hypothetical protein
MSNHLQRGGKSFIATQARAAKTFASALKRINQHFFKNDLDV